MLCQPATFGHQQTTLFYAQLAYTDIFSTETEATPTINMSLETSNEESDRIVNPATNSNSHSHLLRLPAELRNTQWTHVMVETMSFDLEQGLAFHLRENQALGVCRQICAEATPIFYSQNTFMLSILTDDFAWQPHITSIPTYNRPSVSSVNIDYRLPCPSLNPTDTILVDKLSLDLDTIIGGCVMFGIPANSVTFQHIDLGYCFLSPGRQAEDESVRRGILGALDVKMGDVQSVRGVKIQFRDHTHERATGRRHHSRYL